MNLHGLDAGIIVAGLAAGVLVLATHVPLGREVLRRGIIFIDLAVAQMATLGVIFAGMIGWETHGPGVQLAAFVAAVAAGLFLTWTDRRQGEVQEAIIGGLFVLAATGGMLLLANDPRGGEEFRDLLVGQILWVDMHTLWPAAVVAVLVLTLWFTLRERLGHIGFYLLFAISVTASVQLVGVYLVFASLIFPALPTRRMSEAVALAWAFGIGVSGYLLGLLASSVFDIPTGPVIVWFLAVLAVLTAVSGRTLPRRVR